MSILDPTPKLLDLPADEYHADHSRVSHSMLREFNKDPLRYFNRFVKRPPTPHEPTFDMQVGTVLHHIVIENDCDPKPYAVYRGAGRRGSKEWDAWAGDHYESILLKSAEYDEVRAMADGVFRNKTAAWLLARATHREQAIHFADPIIDIALKSRLDLWLFDDGVIADLKSTASAVTPDAFSATALRYGYDTQAAFYQDAAFAFAGREHTVVFVAVEKSDPYRCRVFELDEAFMNRGRSKNLRALRDLKECERTGFWDIPHGDEIITVAEPRWAKYEDEFLTSEV